MVLLALAIGLESYALLTGVRVVNRTRGDRSWRDWVRRAKSPEVPTILLEDTRAVTGLGVALVGSC